MSDLEQLLEGIEVEWKSLGEVASISRGRRVTKRELSPNKPFPVYSGGVTPMGYFDHYNQDPNTITIVKYGTAGFVNFITEKFWANDVCYCVKPTSGINNKYLLYVLKNNQHEINSLVTDAIPAHLPTDVINEFPIPIPPLSVQKEIVRILDTFTGLTAELKTELNARKKQFTHYRDQLLSFENSQVEWKALGEVAEYSKDRVGFHQLDETNYVGVDNLLPDRAGKTISSSVPTSGNSTGYITNDVLIGNIRPYLKKIWHSDICGGTNGDVLVIRVTDVNLSNRFLYHALADANFFEYNMQHAKGAKMPRGNKSKIMEYLIPLPSLAEQEKIVSILDKFDTLLNSTTVGLPKEIELRQKQYEYYRNLLLTFPEPNTKS